MRLIERLINHIRKRILNEKRARFGAEIVAALGRELEFEFGRGVGRRNLFRMIRFPETSPDFEIVSALMTQLGWTPFLHIIFNRSTYYSFLESGRL
jgi:hypothetical protein